LSIAVPGIANPPTLDAVSGASAGMPPQQKMSSLFDKIDTNGSGSITQAQFAQAFQTFNPPAVFQAQGASATFAALDPNGTGSVSKQDFVSGMSGMMASLRADGGPSTAPGAAPNSTLASSLQSFTSLDPSSVSANASPGTLFNATA
jgi:hypothetical protein